MKKMGAKYIVGMLMIEMIVVSGCTSGKRSPHRDRLTPLILTKNLTISANLKEAFTGSFDGVSVDKEGKMYAVDSRLQKIHIFSSDGHYIDSIGGKGKGPGEFIRLDPQIRIQSDTLYVKDNSLHRISLFSLKSRSTAGTINIPNAKINDVSIGHLRDMFPLSNGNILVSFTNPYISGPPKGGATHKMTLSIIKKSGKFAVKKLIQLPEPFPADHKLIYIAENRISVFTNVSFYPDIEIAIAPKGYVYIGKSDSLLLRQYNISGKITGKLQGHYSPIPLTHSDMDSLGNDKSNTFKKAVNQAGLPAHWPAFQHFFFDNRGRCWVQLVTPAKLRQTWWVFSGNQPKWEFRLPSDVTLYQVQAGKAYGLSQSNGGVSSIVRYKIQLQSNKTKK